MCNIPIITLNTSTLSLSIFICLWWIEGFKVKNQVKTSRVKKNCFNRVNKNAVSYYKCDRKRNTTMAKQLGCTEKMQKSVRVSLRVSQFFWILAAILIVSGPVLVKASCPNQCTCANEGAIVDCSKKGLTRIPSNLPRNTITL